MNEADKNGLAEDSTGSNGPGLDFIREAIVEDLKSGRYTYVRTRLPPEPNGWMHIGHAKAFSIDYFIAKRIWR
ncbi:hypothetical protein MASR2M48_28680 [Spirochaetota bacterium]